MKSRFILVLALFTFSSVASHAQMHRYRADELPNSDDIVRLLSSNGAPDTTEVGTKMSVRTKGIRIIDDAGPVGGTTATRDAPVSTGIATGPAAAGTTGFSYPIQFALGSASVSRNAYDALDRIGAGLRTVLSVDPNVTIRIEGHADALGDRDANMALSFRRALAVRAYLVDKYRLSVDRFTVAGFGSMTLLNANDPLAAENRRVEFKRLANP